MKNGFILMVILVTLVMIGIGSVNATVTNIDTGEDFELIQEAIDDSDTKDGHTIVVSPGVYHENVKVNKSLTIKSANENQNDVTIIGRSCSGGVINIIDCSNVNIIGFSVIGAKVPAGITNFYSDGICLLLARNCYIANCSVNRSDCGVRTVLFSFNNTIKHNNIYNNNKEGVYLSTSSNATIVNNNIYDNNKEGVYLSKSSNAVIVNNNIYDNNKEGVHLSISSNAVIANNNIYDNRDVGVSLYKSSNAVIANNNISRSSGSVRFFSSSGIKLDSSNNNTVKDNTVTENKNGIFVLNEIDSIITGNNVSYNEKDGIYMLNVTDSTITANNVSYNEKDGIVVSGTTDSTITGNNVSYNKEDGIVVYSSICEVRYNIACFNGEWGINAIASHKSVIKDNLCENNGKE